MPKATPQYNLHSINPRLAKEWHPTRNGGLNPRTVTPGSGKKVWWICEAGHEWEARIYSRSRGSGCPSCNKPSPSDSHEFLLTNSDLLKEWHPTKNSGLNLRSLPPDFNQKVWWICEDGHEWQDTIKSRMNGKGCPDCTISLKGKRASRNKIMMRHRKESRTTETDTAQLNDILKTSNLKSSSATGFRKSRRYRHKATVILEDASSGTWSYAQTKDFSDDGMLLESEVAFKPGTQINIKFDTLPIQSKQKFFKSTVKWCKELADEDSIATYGIGVKFN